MKFLAAPIIPQIINKQQQRQMQGEKIMRATKAEKKLKKLKNYFLKDLLLQQYVGYLVEDCILQSKRMHLG
jgi:hypothetical protein